MIRIHCKVVLLSFALMSFCSGKTQSQNKGPEELFIQALKSGNKEGCIKLARLIRNADFLTPDGYTLLIKVAESGSKELCDLLITGGAKVDMQGKDGQTDIVSLLLNNGANSDLMTLSGKKALDYAANEDISSLLRNILENR